MTSKEISTSLAEMAKVYDTGEDLPIPQLNVFCSAKDEVVALIRAIGGRFDKDMGREDDREDDPYAYMKYSSQRIPGLTIWIDRSKVCKLIRRPVEWECEPLLSPEDEAEIEAQARA